jgi:hypothetical protein
MNEQICDLRFAICNLAGDSREPRTRQPSVSLLSLPSFSSLPSVSHVLAFKSQIANLKSKIP